jgi:transcriptional regulator with XRE-family HTH domain
LEKKSLEEWIISRKLQANEVAEKAKVDRATISRLISGKQSTKMKTARSIAEALGVGVEQVTEFESLLQPKKEERAA